MTLQAQSHQPAAVARSSFVATHPQALPEPVAEKVSHLHSAS